MLIHTSLPSRFVLDRPRVGRIVVVGFLAVWSLLVIVIVVFGRGMSPWVLYPLVALTLICVPDSVSIKSLFSKPIERDKDQQE